MPLTVRLAIVGSIVHAISCLVDATLLMAMDPDGGEFALWLLIPSAVVSLSLVRITFSRSRWWQIITRIGAVVFCLAWLMLCLTGTVFAAIALVGGLQTEGLQAWPFLAVLSLAIPCLASAVTAWGLNTQQTKDWLHTRSIELPSQTHSGR